MYNSASVSSAAFARMYCSSAPKRLGIADLQGNLIWGRDMDIRFPRPHDYDGDGRTEILGVLDHRMVILCPDDGQICMKRLFRDLVPSRGYAASRSIPIFIPGTPPICAAQANARM